jgi:2-polyprenyl-3-methyl-5-hydroxy-6-metoxy-1,4-benzoquinol methylase
VACGLGRHALWLAQRGLTVTAIDRDAAALAALARQADLLHLPIITTLRNLETEVVSLGVDGFDVIVVTNYLHRALFPTLKAALNPAGLLVYETFTSRQAIIGRPTNPDYLLLPGELERLVDGLELLGSQEGFIEGRYVASVVARRPR